MKTKVDKKHLDQVAEIGCIVCKNVYFCYSPAEIHHIVEGSRRKGDQFVIPLCVPHHRGGSDGANGQFVSRHPYKSRFEAAYGSESDLLEQVRRILDDRNAVGLYRE